MPNVLSPLLVKFALPALIAAASMSGVPAWSQDEPEEPVVPEDGGEGAAAEAPGDAEPDETEAEDEGGPAVGLDEIPELDEQTYEEDDDEFIPTEEIPVDQSIPFPTDI